MKISVIVPVYRAEKYLQSCLDSIEKQTLFDEIELLLVDDGSPDLSGNICDEFAKKHTNVNVIHKQNGGASSARNSGLAAAKAEFIGFVDADDTVEPHYFEKLLLSAETDGCDMAFSAYLYRTDRYEYVCAPSSPVGELLSGDDMTQKYVSPMLEDGCQNGVVTKLFRRKIIEENSIRFTEGLKIGEDKRFVLEYLQHAKAVVYTGDTGYTYLSVSTSAVNAADRGTVECLLTSYDAEKALFTSLGVPESEYIRSAAKWIFLNACVCAAKDCRALEHGEFKCRVLEWFKNKRLCSIIADSADYIASDCGRVHSLYLKGFLNKDFKTLNNAVRLEFAIDKIMSLKGRAK